MATVDADFLIRLASNRNAATAAGTAKEAHAFDLIKTYVTSTDSEVWSGSETMTDGQQQTYDLEALTQEDDAGDTVRSSISFSTVRALAIRNTKAAGSAGTLKAGNASSDAWSGDSTPLALSASLLSIPPAASMVWISPTGGAVSSSSKALQLEADGAQSFEILIVGEA